MQLRHKSAAAVAAAAVLLVLAAAPAAKAAPKDPTTAQCGSDTTAARSQVIEVTPGQVLTSTASMGTTGAPWKKVAGKAELTGSGASLSDTVKFQVRNNSGKSAAGNGQIEGSRTRVSWKWTANSDKDRARSVTVTIRFKVSEDAELGATFTVTRIADKKDRDFRWWHGPRKAWCPKDPDSVTYKVVKPKATENPSATPSDPGVPDKPLPTASKTPTTEGASDGTSKGASDGSSDGSSPSVSPGVSATPTTSTPTTAPSADSAASAPPSTALSESAGAAPDNGVSGANLASTGASVGPRIAIGAAGVVVTGAAMVLFAKRRRAGATDRS